MIAIVFTFFVIGCGGSNEQQSSRPASTEPAAVPDPATESTAPTAAPPEATAPTTCPAEPEAEPANSDQQATDETTDDGPQSEQRLRENAYRLLLPTTSGMLIVDVEIEINGTAIQTHFESRIDAVLAAASGEDVGPTWQQLFKHVVANPTRFRSVAQVNRQQFRQMTKRYDQNRNGQPDRSETAKYLFQNSPTSLPFRLFGTDSYRDVNRAKSAVFTAMDRNHDQALDAAEIEQAAAALQTLDRNSDQRVDTTELSSGSLGTSDAWKRNRSKRWGEVAMDLAGHIDWSMFSYMVGNLNRSGPYGQKSTLLTKLDQDNDKSLHADEAKGLLKTRPDLRLRVSYGPGGNESIRIDSISHEIEPLVETKESRGQIEVFGKSFSFVAQVLPSLSQTNQFPDQAFVMLDANNDGFLDQNEVPKQALQQYSFEDVDSDNDGKLTIEEIRNRLAGEEPIWFIQVRARGAESPDAVFGWLDQNRDNFLSTREIEAVPDLLNALAVDGIVKPASIPDTYLLQFGRGDPNQDAQLFAITPTRSEATDLRPRWAQAMDSNGDGDISRDEFTSTDEHFKAIDDNQDGFIDPHETTSP